MRNTKLRITLREVLYIIAAVAVIFEIYLMKPIPQFRFVDEGIAVFCLAIILFKAFLKGLDRSQTYMLLLMLLLLGIGLASNYYTKLYRTTDAIITDVGNTFKVFVTYVGATLYLKPVKDKKRIIKVLATIMRLFVVVLFVALLLHLTGIRTMGKEVRYGIISFQFINEAAGQLGFVFYFVFLILLVDMRYDRRKGQFKMLFLILAAVVWAFTLRTRAFLFIAMIFGLYWLTIKKGYEIKLNWKTALIGILLMLLFSLDQIQVYFSNDKTARYQFMHYGFYTMKRYFPFGAGFSCYGTDAAVKYYSRLYVLYGFPMVWGLSPHKPIFAHDTYWPAIMAQFGAFGLITMIMIVFRWGKDTLSRACHDKFSYLAALFIVLSLVSSSIASPTFFHFVTVGVCFLLPILFDDSNPKKESGVSYETSNRLHPHI